jgi:hypothetical protein
MSEMMALTELKVTRPVTGRAPALGVDARAADPDQVRASLAGLGGRSLAGPALAEERVR